MRVLEIKFNCLKNYKNGEKKKEKKKVEFLKKNRGTTKKMQKMKGEYR
jgi:hypothetical protein